MADTTNNILNVNLSNSPIAALLVALLVYEFSGDVTNGQPSSSARPESADICQFKINLIFLGKNQQRPLECGHLSTTLLNSCF